MNIDNSNLSKVEAETRDLFAITFELFMLAEKNKAIYDEENVSMTKRLIELYYQNINPDYKAIISNFRRRYVENEALVEKNDSLEEKLGIGLVYDFIQHFDFDRDSFNIFMTGLQIHSLLYKPSDDKLEAEIQSKCDEVDRLMKEAKAEKNLDKLRQAKVLSKSLMESSKFGGNLRKGTAYMKNTGISVPDSDEAIAYYNQFLSQDKKDEYEAMANNPDIFAYIDYVIETTAELIRVQPFNDGNKRTFRSLVNLMFKRRNLPPVYFHESEYKEYIDSLIKGMETGDYDDLKHFYYFKICDSIYELDVKVYSDMVKARK